MKSKILSSILIISLILMTGCGNQNAQQSQNPDSSNNNEPTIQDSVTEGTTEAIENDSLEIEDDAETNLNVDIPDLSTNTSIEETVLFDDGSVKIVAESLDFEYNSPVLHLNFENNGEKNISVSSGAMGYNCNSINGYMVTSMYVNTDIAAGKNSKEDINISADELLALGIDKIREIGIAFHITDDENNEYALTDPSYITTSDYEENNASDNNFIKVMRSGILESIYDMKVDYIGEENLLEGEDVQIVSEGLFTNTDDNSILFVEMKNTGDKTLRVSSSRIAINGVALTTGLWESNEITAGKTLVMVMNLSDVVRVAGGTFDSFGISKIATVETEINCQDLDNNDIFNKVITFKFSDGEAPFDKEGNEVYNSNDVRILSRKVTKDTYDNLHVGMLVENNSDTELRFEVEYDSLSINDTMTDFTAYTLHLQPGKVGILNIEISGYTLEDSDFSNPEDVKNAEFKLNITDANYHDIDEAVVKMEY